MKSSTDKSNGLMGDLESIKALFEEDELEAVPESLSEALNPLPSKEAPEQAPEQATNEATDGAELEAALAELEHDLDAGATDSPIDSPIDSLIEEELPVLQEPLQSFDPATGLSEPLASIKAPSNLEELLGEEFHEATAEVMQRARGLINQHANRWSPQQTDELADALRVRIDAAVAGWIKTSLDAHALELQQRLLNAVRDELARHLEAFEHSGE